MRAVAASGGRRTRDGDSGSGNPGAKPREEKGGSPLELSKVMDGS